MIVVPGGGGESGNYDSEGIRPICDADEQAISGGTSWSTDVDDRELWTGYMRLIPGATVNESIGFMGKGGNDSGLASSFTVYALCYKR